MKVFILTGLFYSQLACAVAYEKPDASEVVTNIPRTLKNGLQMSFNTKKETLWTWAGLITSTSLLYLYDPKIYKYARKFGKKIGFSQEDETKSVKLFSIEILRKPTNLESTFYFFGDGWTQVLASAGFAAYGQLNNDNRALVTSTQILTAYISGTVPTQIIKRASGHEEPIRASTYRGRWKLLPKGYNDSASAYDAFPSGHMMCATATLTVIDENYPEYRNFIRPGAAVILSLLAFEMTNIGVHWASNYPLGMAIGYVAGKSATMNRKKTDAVEAYQMKFIPLYAENENERILSGSAILNY